MLCLRSPWCSSSTPRAKLTSNSFHDISLRKECKQKVAHRRQDRVPSGKLPVLGSSICAKLHEIGDLFFFLCVPELLREAQRRWNKTRAVTAAGKPPYSFSLFLSCPASQKHKMKQMQTKGHSAQLARCETMKQKANVKEKCKSKVWRK